MKYNNLNIGTLTDWFAVFLVMNIREKKEIIHQFEKGRNNYQTNKF